MLKILLSIFALSILIISSTSHAQMPMGSVKTAMFIVDGFFDETMYITRDLTRDESLKKAMNTMRLRKDKTLSELQSVRLIESPGKDRFEHIYSIVESYSDAQIKTMAGQRQGPEQKEITRVIRTMKSLKKKKLKALSSTLKYETYREKNLRPVPIVDKSPFESGGKTGTGGEIWFR